MPRAAWTALARLLLIVACLFAAADGVRIFGPPVAFAQEAAPSETQVSPPDIETLSAVAQAARGPDIPQVDQAAWEVLATRAEGTLDVGTASNDSLEELRSALADFRVRFLAAQDFNSSRIDTLRTQIDALGAPQEGVEELPSLQARRAALEVQFAQLRAPVMAAEEAYGRANGLIVEIDQVIRARQRARITTLGPSPLNPGFWGPALRDLGDGLQQIRDEVLDPFDNAARRQVILRNLPVAIFLSLLGFVLISRGRYWGERAGQWVMAGGNPGARVLSTLVALGQIVLPLLGVLLCVIAVETLDVLGTTGRVLWRQVIAWALAIISARWLADRLFSRHDNVVMIPMGPRHRREARTYATTLACLLVLHLFIDRLATLNRFDASTVAVLGFPIVVIGGAVLYRLGHLLDSKVTYSVSGADGQPPMRSRFVKIFGRAARLIAVASPLLAAVGYTEGAQYLLFPGMVTLAFSGVLIALQHFTSELYRFIARQGDDEEDSLIAVLIGFMLVIASLPILALIWGARVAELTELWTRIGEGFTIGGARFQPSDILVFIIVFAALYSVTRLIQATLRNTILPKTSLDTGGRNAVVAGFGYVGIALAVLMSISAAGIDLSAVAFIFTALSVGIGFGLQNIVQNFVSGIILLIERPIAEGDWIEVNGNMGYVRDISVRSTRIETFDRSDLIVPNGDLISGTVTNYTRGNAIGRVVVPVGVAYGTDTKLVERILTSIARRHDMVLMNPPPTVLFIGFGADSLDFEIRAILRDVNYVMSVKSDMNHEINARFAEAGIEIPFAQRDVWLRNPEVLGGGSGGATVDATEGEQGQGRRPSDSELGERWETTEDADQMQDGPATPEGEPSMGDNR